MPAMPRANNKGTKIAEALLGTPNVDKKASKKKKKVEDRLTFEETIRVR